MTANRPKARDDLATLELDDELVVYDAETGGVHHLNPTAALVFGLCDGSATTTETAAEVAAAYGLPFEEVEPQVRAVVQYLEDAWLLVQERGTIDEGDRHDDHHEHTHDERRKIRMEVPRSD
jgi:PqqD family protein of HPr-rel-A system